MFDYHTPNGKGLDEIRKFKSTLADAIREIDALLPNGREKSLFMTKLEEAVFFGTKAIISKEENNLGKQEF